MTECFGTGSKKVRGRAQRSTDLIEAMYEIAEASQPITGRGVGYKLFTEGKIPSMSRPNMQRVYRLLKEAREEGIIPWHWIVDETRGLETWATWKNPAAFVEQMAGSYRRDFWDQQPVRVQVWSEKGTVRGVLNKVLRKYAVDFQVMHGFSGATTVYGLAQDGDDGRPLVALYVGDYDPSGLFMSECDLPERLERYGGHHVRLNRIAIVGSQRGGLQSFPAASKRKDPRYRWFTQRYGGSCWELDAMDPNALRACIEAAVRAEIEWEAWNRCEVVNDAERELLREVLESWSGAP